MSDRFSNNSILGLLIEFISVALGPYYEVALYELGADNTGRVVQTEFNFLSSQQVGDPMPEDITRLLNRHQFRSSRYITGLTALYADNHMGNMGLLYLHGEKDQKNMLISLVADSTDYYDMAAKLLSMSNLNSKIDLPSGPLEKVPEENLIRLSRFAPSAEGTAEDRSIQQVFADKIDSVILEVMGDQAHVQPAFTQEKRIEIVEKLYAGDVFKVKGMVHQVAFRLYCSDATIYRYLSNIK